MAGFVIVGGSHAAVQMAASARQAGYEDRIALVYAEEGLPHQRPPLSKEFLLGEMDAQALQLRPAAFYREQDIELVGGSRVESLDRERRRVRLVDGRTLPYTWLGIATGARARRIALPGAESSGVMVLRTLQDALALRSALQAARSVVVIGGGFIGLEVAAAAVKLGCNVSVLESQERLIARAVGETVSRFLRDLHASAGADLRFGARVQAIESNGGKVRAVACADGERLQADLVVVGIGAEPDEQLATAAGLRTDDGILVDRHGVTSDPNVVAAGDCTRFETPFSSRPVRLESVQNAVDQARSAGAWIAGRQVPHVAVPWFWSVQHGTRLQIAGLREDGDRVVVRGNPAQAQFTALYLRDGRVAAGESINRPAEHMTVRRLVAAGAAIDAQAAADPMVPLTCP